MNAQEWTRLLAMRDPAVAARHTVPAFDAARAASRRRTSASVPLADHEIAEWAGFLADHGAPPELLARVESFRRPETLAVVTGQQAGLALGPLFSTYKALSAAHWADAIQSAGAPCVPVFWVASDDHDIAEIAPATWLGTDGDPVTHTLALRADAGRPAFAEAIPAAAGEAFLDHFSSTTRATDFRPALIDDLRTALLASGATPESAFVRLFIRWFGHLGIVPVVPRLAFLRARSARLVREEALRPRVSSTLLRRGNEALAATFGVESIHRAGTEFNFFLLIVTDDGPVRARLDWDGDRVVARHPVTRAALASHTQGEIVALASADPARFSPNAALRPLAQDAALPVAIYVAGPSEAVYHAQIAPLYDTFTVPRPAVFPRASAVLVEPRVRRFLAKQGLAADAASIAALASGAGLPGGPAGSGSTSLDAGLAAALDAWRDALGDDARDPAVASGIEKLRANLGQWSTRLEARVSDLRAARSESAERAFRQARTSVAPGGTPQERTLGLLAPALLNYGPAVIDRIREGLRHDAAEPSIIQLG